MFFLRQRPERKDSAVSLLSVYNCERDNVFGNSPYKYTLDTVCGHKCASIRINCHDLWRTSVFRGSCFCWDRTAGRKVWENKVTEKHSFRIRANGLGMTRDCTVLNRTSWQSLKESELLSVALKEKTLRPLFGFRCTECSLRYIDSWLKNVFKSLCYRGTKIPCASTPCRLNFVQWRLMFVVLVVSPSWRLAFWGSSSIFGKFVYPCVSTLCSVSVRFIRGRQIK